MELPLNLQIEHLARAIITSSRAGDWQAVKRYDQQAAELAARLKPVPTELQEAMDKLVKCHRHALQLARREMERLGERVAQLRNNREGLRAYQEAKELL